MNLSREPIKNWFGFTRRERRSTFTLLLIIVVITVIRYAIPDSQVKLEDITSELLILDNNAVTRDSGSSAAGSDKYNPYREKTFSTADKRFTLSKTGYSLQRVTQDKEKFIVDINLADTSALIKLPGIGSVLSVRIIKYRNYLGGFVSIGQLKEVYGLTEETFEIIKTRVKADSSFITRININTADYKELSKVRYLEKYEITSIIKYRQLKGRINSITDLFDNKLITSEKAKKVRPYIRFE